MPYVNSKHLPPLHYLDYNSQSKNAVVLLHGLGATCESWTLQFDWLNRADFRSLAIDIPGFGKSAPTQAGIPEKASLIAEWITAIHPAPISLVGISMGGVIALQMVLDFPQIAQKLVLVNTFAKLDLTNLKTWPYFLVRFLLLHIVGLPAQAKTVARRIFPNPDQELFREELTRQIMQSNPSSYRAAIRSLIKINLQKRLSEIQIPTLIITGELDTTVLPQIQRQLVLGIPGSRQTVIPRAGHAVTIDQSETFNRVLVDFLTE